MWTRFLTWDVAMGASYTLSNKAAKMVEEYPIHHFYFVLLIFWLVN